MKKILTFICLMMVAVGMRASDYVRFVSTNSSSVEINTLTTSLASAKNGIGLYVWYYQSSSENISGNFSISMESAKTYSGLDIASSDYSFGSFSKRGLQSYYVTFKATKPGVYTLFTWHVADSRIMNSTLTVTVEGEDNTLSYENKNVYVKHTAKVINLDECFVSSNSNGEITYSWNGVTPSGATLENSTLTISEPGTYNIKATQAITDTHKSATANFTITAVEAPDPSFLKPMSCVINEIDLTDAAFDYPGYQTMDDNWAANARKLRYVNTNRAYDELPQNYLNDQIVLKTTDESAVASGKIVIGANDKIVSNPVISDEAQFDYVIPNNGNLALADGNSVTFTRNGFPGVNAKGQYTYGTICLPFAVAEEDMPAGFKFEKYENNTMKDGTRYSVFHEVSSLEAGVPYLVYNTGSISANLAITSDAASAWATNPTADSYYMGTFNDLIFDDINSNTATNPYNNVSAGNAEHKGELNNYFASLYNYNSDGYLMANPGGDKIKKSSKTVFNKTMLRPFRAYFLLAKSAPAGAKAMGVLHFSLDDELPTAISYLDAEGNEIEIVDVYTVGGVRIAKDRLQTEALNNLPAGLYILSNGKKVSKK